MARALFLKDIEQQNTSAKSAVKIAKYYTFANLAKLAPFGSFESNHLSLVREDGAMDLYDGNLRAINAEGEVIFDQVDYQQYVDFIAEEVRDWSYMKFPFIRSVGPEKGWYRVGPLARLNTASFIDTPLAEAARQEFRAVTSDKPNNITMAYHWARMIELLHSIEKIRELFEDRDLQGTDLVTKGERREVGIGLIEAPRGTLFHHYKVDKNDLVVSANLIVSTTHNNEPMNRAVAKVAQDHLQGVEITEGLLNHVEVAIRAYDPCLSCATHALGQMPMEITLTDADGQILNQKRRE